LGDAHPPLGFVSFVDQNNAAIPNQSGTCATNGLGHLPDWSNRPTGTFTPSGTPLSFGVPLPLLNVPDYVSWCTAVFSVPAGTTQIYATYSAESIATSPKPHKRLAYNVVPDQDQMPANAIGVSLT
jgi:hypothetical protein